MDAVIAAQTLPNQGMLSRLDFSYCNTLNDQHSSLTSDAHGSQVGGFLGHTRFGGLATYPGAQQSEPDKAYHWVLVA